MSLAEGKMSTVIGETKCCRSVLLDFIKGLCIFLSTLAWQFPFLCCYPDTFLPKVLKGT